MARRGKHNREALVCAPPRRCCGIVTPKVRASVKRIPRLLALLFVLLFLVALVLSLRTTVSLSHAFSTADSDAPAREYHVALFLPETSALFFGRVADGAYEAARKFGVALTVHPIGPDALEFRMARFSGIDGAIIYPYIDEAETRLRLEQLDREGIPVVLIEHGVADDLPWAFVGTNSFDVGRRIGELVAQLGDEPVHLTVVYSDKSPGIASEKELVELGLTTTLGRRLAAPVTRKRTGLNPLDAENLTYQLLRTEPHTNVLVFTDTNDTLASMQVIIDLNLVGQVQVIGFGITETIRDHLDRGILAGTIVVNPHQIGFDAVRVLAGLMRDGYSPAYVDTGVELVRGGR